MNLQVTAYALLDEVAAWMDHNDGDPQLRERVEEWLIACEKQTLEADEILDRVRRIETRLCVLMQHAGVAPVTDGTFKGAKHG